MPFQSTVNVDTNLGVPGDIVLDEPHRIQPTTLDANGGSLASAFVKNATTGVASQGGVVGAGSSSFTASIAAGPGSSGTLTVTAVASGTITLGQTISGTGVTAGTTVTGYLTGTGGNGTYLVSVSQTVASEAMTGASGPVFVFAGIAVKSKIFPQFGASATDPLAPSLSLEPNGQAALMTLGSFVANIPNAFNVGDVVGYSVTTGALASAASASALPSGYAAVPNCQIYGSPSPAGFAGNTSASGGLTICRLTAPN